MKFSDYSKYKTNELHDYFRGKQQRLIESRKKITPSPIAAAIFSAFFTGILWTLRESVVPEDHTYYKLLLYLLLPLAAGLIYFSIYILYFLLIHPIMLSKILNRIENWHLSRSIMSKEEYNPFDSTSALERFNKEIVNQISLALTLTEDINTTSGREEENHYFANEALRYIDVAILELMIVLRELKDEIKNNDNPKIRRSRIRANIKIAEKVVEKASVFLSSGNDDDKLFISGIEKNINSCSQYLLNIL